MATATQYGANNHGRTDAASGCIEITGPGLISNVPPMNANFYSYSCEWIPSNIKYYFNNNSHPIREYNGPYVPRYPRWIYANVAVDPFYPPNLTTPFPSKMEIDYIRHYTLKMDCSTQIIQSNFDFTTHNYSVKKLYYLTNFTFPNNGKHTLRATDYILLDGDITVPIGSEFAIIPTPCF